MVEVTEEVTFVVFVRSANDAVTRDRKKHPKKCIFLAFSLHNSKKSSTFAVEIKITGFW